MALEIVENYIDISGYRIVRVQIDGGSCIMLKFPPGKTVEEMKDAARVVIDAELENRQRIEAEISRRNNIKNVIIQYFAGTLTNNQKVQLLEVLIAEWKD